MNQVEVKRRQIEAGSCLIGLINLIIWNRLLGNSGLSYLVLAMENFFFFHTIVSGALSDSLGRILRGRGSKGQYRNASLIRKRSMVLQGVAGLAVGALSAACAGWIGGTFFQVRYSSFLILVMSPALFLRAVSAVLEGYFRGEGSELPGTVSAVLRQLLLMGFGLLFSGLLGDYGEKVSRLLREEAYTAMYGGVGIAIAIDLTELLVLLFLLLIYLGNRHSIRKQENGGMKRTESLADTVRILCGTRGIPMLLLLLAQLPLGLGAVFYRKSVTETAVFAENYGLFAGTYLVVCGFAVLLIYAVLVPASARTVALLRREEQRSARESFHGGLQTGVALSLFFAVFVAVMAQQLSGCFQGAAQKVSVALLQQGSAMIVILTLGLYFSVLLLRTGKRYLLMGCLGAADILFIVVTSVCLNVGETGKGVLSLAYGALVAGAVYGAAAGFFCCRLLHMGIDWLRVILIPLGTAGVTGLLCLLLGKALTSHLGNPVTVIVCLVPAFLIYWVLLLLFRCFRESDLEFVPGARLIYGVGQLLRLF